MGSHHAHTPDSDRPLRLPAQVRRVLVAVVVLIAVGTAVGAALLWPRGPLPHSAAVEGVQQDTVHATVVTVRRHACAGTSDDRLADGSLQSTVPCADVRVRLGEGPDAGSVVTVTVTGPTVDEGLAPGLHALVARFPDVAGADPSLAPGASKDVYAWVDVDRAQPMWLLAAVFVVVVLMIARLRGLAALAGIGAGFAMVLVFLLPALRHGENPAAVTLVGSVAVMLVVLYASHGISAKTTTALLGTVTALGVSAVLAVWAASAAHLDGQTGEDALSLSQLVGARTISAAVVSGLVLVGLGVLNDVTVTQASAIWELRAAAPHLPATQLITRGMRVGRDHLASTVYTIAFAYAGVSLPVLLLIQVYDRPLTEVLTSAPIAQDVVGVLVAGIGLALAIPLTTVVAGAVAATAAPEPDLPPPAPVPEPAMAGSGPTLEQGAGEGFQEGVLVRRRRRGRQDDHRQDHPGDDDQLSLDASDWSSWPT